MTQEDPRIVELRAMREKVAQGGGADRIAKQHAKGKGTARERLAMLFDPGTFFELEPYSAQRGDMDGEKIPGDGVVTGFGQVEGRTVYAYAQDFTVQGGALGETQSKKICRAMDMAAQNGAPMVGLLDSGGARIQEGVMSLGGYAEIFRRNVQYSGIIPQISIIMGPCAGGATYSPAVTDLIIMVEKQSYMFITGPEVIKSVTNEIIDFEGLGGAEAQTAVSGVAHLHLPSEKEAIDACKRILSYLPSNNVDNAPTAACSDDPARMDEELNHIVPLETTAAYSMHEVLEHVVDQGSFLEIQPNFARNAIVGFARLAGQPVGIVAQEPLFMAGVIDIDASDKIARFVRFCDNYNLPVIAFVDTPGFLPGVDQEHRGIIRHGAKIIYAFADATVPKISVITRKAYGGAYVVMGSKFLGADLNLGWPSAEIAVMGPDGAVNIIKRKEIEKAADPAAERARLAEEYRREFLNPYAAAEKGYLDDIIEPKETRPRLIAALQALRGKSVNVLPRKHGNIPL
ncbi:MAG TPA: acyl-CoA carboxylase subunit beta [Anaerolineaceae bacterium]|nr:acyl-CoA carboxylase subunit beta [Anaerolineaceae bacterium]HPN53723.1 acyl-CoA carboxylase subunit beta [Anaerolineaceae bacterium]